MSDVLTLPLDPTGKATTNDITGENQTIGTNPVRAFATNYGAFFASSLKLIDQATGQPLNSNQFFTAIVYDLATAKYGVAVNDTLVGAVVITDPAVSSTLSVAYQALGGGYQSSLTALVADLIQYEPAARPVSWPSVIDRLAETPASEALHDTGQAGLITFEYVVHVLDRMTQMAIMGDPLSQERVQAYANAMESGQIAGMNAVLTALYAHEANHSNPHQLSAVQVGAMTFAQQDAAVAVETGNRVTEDGQLTQTLTAHETNYNNPHQLTLAQLGMYSSAQVTSAISSAQATLNATLAANGNALGAHINNLNNPHQDSTTSLGTLTVSQIQTAIANAATVVTNGAASATATLSAHTANYNNPHAVTPAQIGTWLASALTALQSALTSHTSNYSNPHQVTITQIAGSTANQFNAALDAAITRVSEYYTSNYNAIVNHVGNLNNPHGDSAQAMGALGPWNLGQLEADLNYWQNSINNSGHPITEGSLDLQNNASWSGSLTEALYYQLPIYVGYGWMNGGTEGYTGDGNPSVGGGMPLANPHPGGGTIIGFLRHSGWTMFIVESGSLDGVNYTSSLGENVVLTNSLSYSFDSNLTVYAAQTGVGNLGGGSRSFYVNFTGGSAAGQPPDGYINDVAPPPPSCGGGQGGQGGGP